MGYLFLCFSLLFGVTKGYCGKKTSGYAKSIGEAVFVNTVRMLLCMAIGLLLILAGGDIALLAADLNVILISAVSGLFTAVFVVCWLISVRKNAYMLLDVFLMLGTLVPLIASMLIWDEGITFSQWIGMAVLFAAVLIMCSYNNSIKSRMTVSSFLLLFLCGVANGLADLSQKLFVKYVADGSVAVFNFYTYLFAALILIAATLLFNRAATPLKNTELRKTFGYIAVMAVCLFLHSYFKTLAAGHLSAVLLYPLSQGAALILSSVMSVLLFKERMTAKGVVGICLAFCGLIIINLL